MSKNFKKETSLLSPKLDVVFQALFGEVGSEKITSKFLEAILQQKINTIDLSKNLVLRRDYPKDKLGVLDIIAQINDGEYCNIEMQVAQQEEIIERMLYYWGRVYTKQIKSGESYDILKKTIVILITNFNVKGLETLEYHSSWNIIEEKYRKTILTKKLEFHIIELPKIIEVSNENDMLLDWLLFLDNPKCERVMKKMKENKELKQANEKLETLSQDEKLQRLAELREKAIIEYNTAVNSGFKQGVKQGTLKIAIQLLQNGLDVQFVHKVTKLSIEEIEELKRNLDILFKKSDCVKRLSHNHFFSSFELFLQFRLYLECYIFSYNLQFHLLL